jgi:hypothetical protein
MDLKALVVRVMRRCKTSGNGANSKILATFPGKPWISGHGLELLV